MQLAIIAVAAVLIVAIGFSRLYLGAHYFSDVSWWLCRRRGVVIDLHDCRPLDPITGFDANFSHAFPNSTRPLGYARNSLRTGMQLSVDVRILKYFKIGEHKLDLAAEGFNLLNHANVVSRQSEFGPGLQALSSFNRPTASTQARLVQFSVDFEF